MFASVNLRISKTLGPGELRQLFGGSKPAGKDEGPYKLSFGGSGPEPFQPN